MKTFPLLRLFKILLIWALGLVIITPQSSCKKPVKDKSESKNDVDIVSNKPILIVIGEDLSGTFYKFTPISKDNLMSVCEVVSHGGAGGTIAFFGIGTETTKGYITCSLKPLERSIENPTPSEKIRHKNHNNAILQSNQSSIQGFLENAEKILNKKKQQYTDINGFFDKVGLLLNSPSYNGYSTWLYVNSDGKQSTLTSTKVDCKLLPSVDNFCTSGWKTKPDCSPTAKFLDPGQFIDYFQRAVGSSTKKAND